ncbi:hypothetical protein KQI76_08800 [Amphibacillus sp. MSJ-3]|uniref:hypothetical protein n=1 Tax=Amphibacillus sp. MSJ-3 TaxID=2841505 RepID=UPI001C0ED0D2|nr:hypothetical protein [Amphibacillus sp. MSJ-3]MBU5595255.1 hypothetical protein [Amphibacillus sp. MSJ-3]
MIKISQIDLDDSSQVRFERYGDNFLNKILDMIIEKLSENNLFGKVFDERLHKVPAGYENQQTDSIKGGNRLLYN